MTPREIADRLARQAEAVAKMLLPNGKKQSGEWRVGSTSGDAGESMGVHLNGDKAGVWCDFATGESGDLLDLWCAAKGVQLAEAIREAKAYLGISEPHFEGSRKKTYVRPQKPKAHTPRGPELEWLINERCLSERAISEYKIATDAGKVFFPFLRTGELVMCKFRAIKEVDGKKVIMPTSKDQEPCLFGWQAIPSSAREVTICEGELDALSLFDYGFPALSVPFGGGTGAKHEWIENEFENLERFDTIFICMDNDKAGKDAAKEIIERLGSHRCRLVNLPAKDANECLKQGVPSGVIQQAFRLAVHLDPSELRRASMYSDDIYYEIYPEERPEGPQGFRMPWKKTHEQVEFRTEELTIVNGVNGHGKSQWLGHVILGAMREGKKCCIASMELSPGRLLGRMTKQACGLPQSRPSKPYVEAVTSWYDGKLWIFDVVGTAKIQRILEVFEYAFKRYGIDVFVIDSLMKCGLNEDDYNGQKQFIEKLCDFKNKFGVHVFLVTHSRKSESEEKPTGKMDVKGTGAITDLADHVCVVWRNKKKEKLLEQSQFEEGQDASEVENMPDCVVFWTKQRNGDGWEGSIPLWFCRNSLQYMAGPDSKPFQFVNYSERAAA